MKKRESAWNSLAGPLGAWLPVVGGLCVLFLCPLLRDYNVAPNPLRFAEFQFATGIIAITFAGAAFVRFRGTQERLPLVLAIGFATIGVTLAIAGLAYSSLTHSPAAPSLRDPVLWVAGSTLLAILFASALLIEKGYASSRHPGRDIAISFALIVLATFALSFIHWQLPIHLVVQPGHFFPRPGNLIPAVLFLVAAILCHRRLKLVSGPFDISLCLAAAMNFWCSLAAAQSDRTIDAPFVVAGALQFGSYAFLLFGALVDNIRLFRDIQRLAASDPVTGLLNYRSLVQSLETEMQRTDRNGRPFALLLFDLDGLKQLNDEFGHHEGTRAICRVADVLRSQSRSIDSAARHGGDEFALLLPETTEQGAREVLTRICLHVASDSLLPPISLSAGLSLYPTDAGSLEMLMDAADRSLYSMKQLHNAPARLSKRFAV
ncbi:MAG TPA: GGDEF domain-containing protein [Candidatus Acidoferrum sp.]|nr:GGDEF domain-containing protein [Candidatus Acidoferrum sp.]